MDGIFQIQIINQHSLTQNAKHKYAAQIAGSHNSLALNKRQFQLFLLSVFEQGYALSLIYEYQFGFIFEDIAVVVPNAAATFGKDAAVFVISGNSIVCAQIHYVVLFENAGCCNRAYALEGVAKLVVAGNALLRQYPQPVITVTIQTADCTIHKTAHPVVPVFIQAEPRPYPY